LAKALKIPQSFNFATGKMTYYYVEYRLPIGADNFLSTAAYASEPSGVFVHLGTDGDATGYLLDMTPATVNPTFFHDASLAVGTTYTDPGSGMSITPMWASSSWGGIYVSMP
jgi:hypothetical protein